MVALKVAVLSVLALGVLGFAPGDPCPNGGNFCACMPPEDVDHS